MQKIEKSAKNTKKSIKQAPSEIPQNGAKVAKQAPSEVPQNGAKVAKQAPSEVPQNGGKKSSVGVFFKKTFWLIALVAATFVGMLGSEILLGLVLRLFLPEGAELTPMQNSLFSAISYALTILVIIVIPPKIFKKLKPSTREKLGLTGLPTWTDLGLAMAGYVVVIILEGLITMLFTTFSWFDADEAQDLGYNLYMQGWERGVAFLAVAVVAPIAEEIIFRGWLYGKLRINVPKPIAIIATSLLFGLVHGQWNVGISVFMMSVVMCLLRELTGTIYAGMLVHMINNGVAFFLVYVIGVA